MDIKKDHSLPPLQFKTALLTNEEAQRWRKLTRPIMTQRWWKNLIFAGCVVAGGAALYILDHQQSINDVGDIDIWIPMDGIDESPLFKKYVFEIVKFCQSKDWRYECHLKNSLVTIRTPKMCVQLIASHKQQAQEILRNFDYDAVQCAIVAKKDHDEIYGMRSLAAIEAHKTRIIKWKNIRLWKFAKFGARAEIIQQERDAQRQYKLRYKNFCFRGDGCLLAKQKFVDQNEKDMREENFSFDLFGEKEHHLTEKEWAHLSRMHIFSVPDYIEDEETNAFKFQYSMHLKEDKMHTLWPKWDWCEFYAKRQDAHDAFLYFSKLKKDDQSQKTWFGLRNLELLADGRNQIESVFGSVISDIKKVSCVDPCEVLEFVLARQNYLNEQSLIQLIKRHFDLQ